MRRNPTDPNTPAGELGRGGNFADLLVAMEGQSFAEPDLGSERGLRESFAKLRGALDGAQRRDLAWLAIVVWVPCIAVFVLSDDAWLSFTALLIGCSLTVHRYTYGLLRQITHVTQFTEVLAVQREHRLGERFGALSTPGR